MYSNVHIEPKNMTVLCTYQCTAACKQCCFESSPHIKGRLSGDVIRKRITEAHQAIPRMQVDVFSGGEAFLDRQSVVTGTSVSVRVDLGVRRIIKQKKRRNTEQNKN